MLLVETALVVAEGSDVAVREAIGVKVLLAVDVGVRVRVGVFVREGLIAIVAVRDGVIVPVFSDTNL